MVTSLREDLDLPDLPFISATIGSFIANKSKFPFYAEINDILLNAGTAVDHYSCVDARDLTGHIGDYVHYNTDSQQEIGRRYVKAFFEMNDKKHVHTSTAEEPYITPEMQTGVPEPGKRVIVIPPEYEGTDVYYSLYLPGDYSPQKHYPVIVEYTGNYAPSVNSTGQVKDAHMGYALSIELNAIWVVMPYVSEDKAESMIRWWGSEENTIDYCLTNLKRICMNYNGNPAEVFIIGFSRGAIGVNYLGLYNERVADTWLGLFAHDHYDGERVWHNYWGSPIEKYQAEAAERLQRLKGRATIISQQSSASNHIFNSVSDYIYSNNLNRYGEFTLIPVDVGNIVPQGIPSHTDNWLNYDSPEADKVVDWFRHVIEQKPGTYSLQGTVKFTDGSPVPGLLVETGIQGVDYKGVYTHFTLTDENGFYKIEGLTSGKRFILLREKQQPADILKSKNVVLRKDKTVDFSIKK